MERRPKTAWDRLGAHSESKQPDGLVVQVGRGLFKLNPKRRQKAKA